MREGIKVARVQNKYIELSRALRGKAQTGSQQFICVQPMLPALYRLVILNLLCASTYAWKRTNYYCVSPRNARGYTNERFNNLYVFNRSCLNMPRNAWRILFFLHTVGKNGFYLVSYVIVSAHANAWALTNDYLYSRATRGNI